jgi:hypothetical protein
LRKAVSALKSAAECGTGAQSPGQSPSPNRDQVRLRITVKNGRIVSITPIGGPSSLGAAAARWVKQKWEFAPDQTGTFTPPVVFQRAK